MTTEVKLVVEGSEKACELAKHGTEVGGAMAAAEALTIKQFSKYDYASINYAAHFHVQVEEWKDWDGIVPKEKRNFAIRAKEKRMQITQVRTMLQGLARIIQMYEMRKEM